MSRNLAFVPSIAPYRVDYYNSLHEECSFDIYFLSDTSDGQLFSSDDQWSSCRFEKHYLKSFVFLGRHFPLGLRKLIKDSSPDCIIVPEFSVLTILVLLLRKVLGMPFRVVSQCDDSSDMIESGGFSRWHSFARKLCMPLLDDVIIADTKAVDWYRSHYSKGVWMPIIHKEDGVPDYQSVQDRVALIWKQIDAAGKVVLLFVGRLVGIKNVQLLIRACRNVDIPYHLLIVGDGPEMDKLKQLAQNMEVEASFVGSKIGLDLYSCYYSADVFVLPSVLEPFGAVTGEALLCGCKCCISAKAGSSCLIDESNGAVFSPDSENSLETAIRHVLTIPSSDDRSSRMPVTYQACFDAVKTIL